MKIALLVPPITVVNPQLCGGVERIALNELEYLRRRGVDARLYVRGYVGDDHPCIEAIKEFQYGEESSRKYYAWFAETAKDADVLHGMNAPLLSLVPNKPKTLIHMHNLVTLPYYEVANIKYKDSFFAFCSSFLLEDFLSKHPDFPHERCFVLHNGVNTDFFEPKKPNHEESLMRVLYAGAWNKQKGIFVFLKAIRSLEKKRHDFEALIAGSPYLYDTGDPLKWQVAVEKKTRRLVSRMRSARIANNVKYSEMPQLYRSSDIFVFPSIWQEPFGLCLIEAMASATPVIASHVGGIPEFIKEQKTGLLVKPGDPEVLADAIEYLLDNDCERRRFGAEGRRAVEDSFSMELHAQNLMKIYEKIEHSDY